MPPGTILERLAVVGVSLRAEGGNVVATPRAAITPELAALIRAGKPELVTLLTERAELGRLINLVADVHGFTDADRAEAISIHLEHPVRSGQIELFRLLALEATKTRQDKSETTATPPNAGERCQPPDINAENHAAHTRRQWTVDVLADRPEALYALYPDTQSDPGIVTVALAIRGQVTCDLSIPRRKWDGVLFLEMLEQHGGTVH